MNINLVLENDDVFCGNTFVMTLNRFDTIDITVKEGRLFINNTFVKLFNDNEEAKSALSSLIKSLDNESFDYDMFVA